MEMTNRIGRAAALGIGALLTGALAFAPVAATAQYHNGYGSGYGNRRYDGNYQRDSRMLRRNQQLEQEYARHHDWRRERDIHNRDLSLMRTMRRDRQTIGRDHGGGNQRFHGSGNRYGNADHGYNRGNGNGHDNNGGNGYGHGQRH